MRNYRLALTLFFSVLLHLLLLWFLLDSKALGFKKGIGENPKIKISSFEFASLDSKASQPMPPTPVNPKSSTKPQRPKKTSAQKTLDKTQVSQKEKTQEQNQEEQNQKQITQQEEIAEQPTSQKTLPIEQSLSYQLADAQTKKQISEFYGEEFGQLGTQEQEFILNNLAIIGRITQSYLRYPPNAGMLAQSGGNAIEFYLHPNGDISELKILKKSGFILLDRNSIKTIEIAYKDYPHPKTKTLIRFFINYYLIR